MLHIDDTQPIRSAHDTMVFEHPGMVEQPQPTPVGRSGARKALTALGAVVLVAVGAVGGGIAVASTTYSSAEVQVAEQTGYDAGYAVGSDDAAANAKKSAGKAYSNGYRQGFEAGKARAAALASAEADEVSAGQPQRPGAAQDED